MSPAALAALHADAIAVPRPWSEAEFRALLADRHCFLVGDGGGFALGRVVAGEAELLTIVTQLGARRQGIGRARLLGYEAAALERGAEQSFLEVARTNGAACALYASAGYRQTGIRPGYYTLPGGKRIDALVLAKTLTRG